MPATPTSNQMTTNKNHDNNREDEPMIASDLLDSEIKQFLEQPDHPSPHHQQPQPSSTTILSNNTSATTATTSPTNEFLSLLSGATITSSASASSSSSSSSSSPGQESSSSSSSYNPLPHSPSIRSLVQGAIGSKTNSIVSEALNTIEMLRDDPNTILEEDYNEDARLSEQKRQDLAAPSSSSSSSLSSNNNNNKKLQQQKAKTPVTRVGKMSSHSSALTATTAFGKYDDSDSDDDDSSSGSDSGEPYTADELKQIYGPDDELSDEDDFSELFGSFGAAKRKQRRLKGKSVRGSRKKIPDNIAKLIGQANMNFINKEFSKAVELLCEAVRLKPNLPDPYHTLGLVYEELKQQKRALEFYMIAAILTPKDANLWKRNVQLSIEAGNIQQAIYCLTRIIRLQPNNHSAIFDRALYHIKLNNKKKAIEDYKLLHEKLPSDGEVVIQLATLYYETGQPDNSIEVLKRCVEQNIAHANLTMVNMLCELFMGQAQYQNSIKIIEDVAQATHVPLEIMPIDIKVKYGICKSYEGELLTTGQKIFHDIIESYEADQIRDIFLEIAETYFALEEYQQAIAIYKRALTPTYQKDAVVWAKIGKCYKLFGDYLRAAEHYGVAVAYAPDDIHSKLTLSDIYKDLGDHDKALQVLDMSVTPDGNNASTISLVVKRLLERDDAEYQENKMDDVEPYSRGENEDSSTDSSDDEKFDEASDEEYDSDKDPDYKPNGDEMEDVVDAYDEELEPEQECLNDSPRPQLRKKRQRENRKENVEDIRVIARKGWILFSTKRYEEFIRICFPFIKSILDLDSMVYVVKPSYKRRRLLDLQAQYKVHIKKTKTRWDEVEKKVNRRRAPNEQWTWNEALYALGSQELFYFLLTTCKAFAYTGRYAQFVQIMDTLLKSQKDTRLLFHWNEEKSEKIHQLRYLYIGIAFNNQDYERAYKHITHIIREIPYNISLWNLFNMIVNRAKNLTPSAKFAIRLLAKFPSSVPLMVLVGHNCSMSGSYRLALGEYFKAYRTMPNEPIICLCIGINYLNLVMNRRTANRHLLVMQAFTFLYKYYQLRNGDQEANFNLARAYHQIGVNYLAVIYYNRVLEQCTASSKEPLSTTSGLQQDIDSAHYMTKERLEDETNDKEHDVLSDDEDEETETPQLDDESNNLCREAAYNLCLIYKKSGNLAMIDQLMKQYLTI